MPTPHVGYNATTNQPLSQPDNTQTSDAESDVQLPSSEGEQTTSHTPSHVSDSSSSANVLSDVPPFLAQPTLEIT